MQLQLVTRTPLWTGDVDNKSTTLQPTGIIGSLRWWYEVIVRGLGGWACDPTKQTCIYDSTEGLSSICDACRLFGTTGWARRFRLTLESSLRTAGVNGQATTTGQRKKVNSTQNSTWYFNGGLENEFTMKTIALSPGFDSGLLEGVVHLLVKRATLAAKSQLGYGLIQFNKPSEFDAPHFIERLEQECHNTKPNLVGVPGLTDFFFAEIDITSAKTGTNNSIRPIQHVLNLKYDLRNTFRNNPASIQPSQRDILRHFVCGESPKDIKKARVASKIAFSQPLNNLIRVWGWIPEQLPLPSVTRRQVVELVYDTLQNYSTQKPVEWFDYKSIKDVRTYPTPNEFLKTLLK